MGQNQIVSLFCAVRATAIRRVRWRVPHQDSNPKQSCFPGGIPEINTPIKDVSVEISIQFTYLLLKNQMDLGMKG